MTIKTIRIIAKNSKTCKDKKGNITRISHKTIKKMIKNNIHQNSEIIKDVYIINI